MGQIQDEFDQEKPLLVKTGRGDVGTGGDAAVA